MKKDPAIFLQHILESIQTIEEYTQGLSEDAFLEDRRTQDAVVRRLEIIGEAVRKLPEETKNLASDAAWRQIMAMRNILIHEYFGVDLNSSGAWLRKICRFSKSTSKPCSRPWSNSRQFREARKSLSCPRTMDDPRTLTAD